MGVNWWGESPLCRNTIIGFLVLRRKMIQALDRSNCGVARLRGKEASVKPDEPTNRKII
jgi:hypothetical protein